MNFTEHTLSGWGNYPQVATHVGEPRSQSELREALLQKSIIARGLGRSYGDQAINKDKYTLLTTRLNHFLSFDKTSGILECEAGVSLEEIIEVCAPLGWFPMVTPGTKFVTIGGSIANDIHGKAHHVDGTFVNCVLEFSIMLADGAVKTASRQENTDLFWASFGGLGLLGIILSARIQLRKIETTYFRQKAVVVKNLDELLDSLDRYDHEYNYSVAWVDSLASGKSLGKGVLTLGNHATKADLPEKFKANPLFVAGGSKLSVPFYLPEFALNTLSVFLLNRAIHFVQSSAANIAHYEKFFYPLDAIHHWNKGYGKRGFIQYQFVIPVSNGNKNIRTILEKIASSGCVPFLNVLKKFGKKQGMLSFPFEGYTFAIDFPYTPKLAPFIASLDQLILDFGGRIYLGKDAMLKKEVFQAMYPELGEWLKIKAKYDPNNLFSSDISRRLGLEV